MWTLRKLFFFQNHHSRRSVATLRKLIRRPLFPPSLIECRGETNDTELSFESFLLGISVTLPVSFSLLFSFHFYLSIYSLLSLSVSLVLLLSLSFWRIHFQSHFQSNIINWVYCKRRNSFFAAAECRFLTHPDQIYCKCVIVNTLRYVTCRVENNRCRSWGENKAQLSLRKIFLASFSEVYVDALIVKWIRRYTYTNRNAFANHIIILSKEETPSSLI